MSRRVITHNVFRGPVTLCSDGKHDAEYLDGVYYGVKHGDHEGACDVCDEDEDACEWCYETECICEPEKR